MKFCEICVRHIDHIFFQCGEKLPENGEKNWTLNPAKRNRETWILLKQTAFGHRLKSRNFERCFGLEESD
jgi:hypothetical protein